MSSWVGGAGRLVKERRIEDFADQAAPHITLDTLLHRYHRHPRHSSHRNHPSRHHYPNEKDHDHNEGDHHELLSSSSAIHLCIGWISIFWPQTKHGVPSRYMHLEESLFYFGIVHSCNISDPINQQKHRKHSSEIQSPNESCYMMFCLIWPDTRLWTWKDGFSILQELGGFRQNKVVACLGRLLAQGSLIYFCSNCTSAVIPNFIFTRALASISLLFPFI